MPVFNAIVIPELQYYFGMFVKKSTLNKNETPFPTQLNRQDLYEDRSFLRLLFDDSWPPDYTYFYYCYRERSCPENWPFVVRDRAKIYPQTASYWIACDCTSSYSFNIFNLGAEELSMLNQLLLYRLDACSYTLTVDYSTLTTNLGRLIWLYLNFKVNDDYSKFDDTSLISNPNNTLECMYEYYLIENVFSFVENKGR